MRHAINLLGKQHRFEFIYLVVLEAALIGRTDCILGLALSTISKPMSLIDCAEPITAHMCDSYLRHDLLDGLFNLSSVSILVDDFVLIAGASPLCLLHGGWHTFDD